MNGPWSTGAEAEQIRQRELQETVLAITRLLISLSTDEEVVAVTATVLDSMPEELSYNAMKIVAERMARKAKREARKK